MTGSLQDSDSLFKSKVNKIMVICTVGTLTLLGKLDTMSRERKLKLAKALKRWQVLWQWHLEWQHMVMHFVQSTRGNPGHIVGITHLFILTNFRQVSVKCLVLTKAAYYDNFPRNGSAVSWERYLFLIWLYQLSLFNYITSLARSSPPFVKMYPCLPTHRHGYSYHDSTTKPWAERLDPGFDSSPGGSNGLFSLRNLKCGTERCSAWEMTELSHTEGSAVGERCCHWALGVQTFHWSLEILQSP